MRRECMERPRQRVGKNVTERAEKKESCKRGTPTPTLHHLFIDGMLVLVGLLHRRVSS